MIWDIDPGKLEACKNLHTERLFTDVVDVSQASAVDEAMKRLITLCGKLDILVNGAGIVGPNCPFWEASLEQWDRVVRINLNGLFLVSRAATPHLVKNAWGRIVNIASVTANEGPKNLGPYAATKAAVVGLTKSMGKDLAGAGVLVNAITPALIATELLQQLSNEYLQAALSRIPLGRPGTLDEAAALITWLCSEECSFSTGACFDLSGGRGL